jgi:hypothetical protein
MFRMVTSFALICSFLQVAPLANGARDEQQNPAQPVNAVIEWNRTLLTMVRTPGAQAASIHATRNFAILHAPIYDAVNNIDPRFSPYLVRLPDVPRSASEIAAADEVAHDVLVFLYPAFQVPGNQPGDYQLTPPNFPPAARVLMRRISGIKPPKISKDV